MPGTLDPFATGVGAHRARRPRDQSATVLHGAAEDVQGGSPAWVDLRRPGDRDGELMDTYRPPCQARSRSRSASSCRDATGLLGGEGGRPARATTSPERGETPELRASPGDRNKSPTSCGTRETAPPSRSSAPSGHVRALPGNRPGRRLLRGAGANGHRHLPAGGRGPGRGRRPRPPPSFRFATRSHSCRSGRWSAEEARSRAATARRCPRPAPRRTHPVDSRTKAKSSRSASHGMASCSPS